MDAIRKDVKYALAVLRREWGFAVAAVAALALGIGATTAVFSVVYGVLLRPLPFPESDRLVRIYEEHPGAPKPPGDLETSNTTLNAWMPRLRTLEDIAPYYALEYTVAFPEGPVRVHGGQVGPALFPLLRATPQAGRFFLPGEDAPRANLFVVISDRAGPVSRDGQRGVRAPLSRLESRRRPRLHGVGNVLKDGADKKVVPEIYTVARRDIPSTYEIDVVVRTNGDPARAASTLRQAVRSIDADMVVGTTQPLASRVRASFAQPRFATAVLAAFATLALVLASLGLFGVLSYTVTQRRRELSVRAALGADRRRLLSLVLREGLALTAMGLCAGLGGALLLAQAIRGLLFGITPADPLAYAVAPLVLLPVAAMACLLPARRAASAAPAEVLRLV